MQSWMKYTPVNEITQLPMAVPCPMSLSAHHTPGHRKERRSEKGETQCTTHNQAHPPHSTNPTHTYLWPFKPKHRPKCASKGSKPQEHEGHSNGGQPHTLDRAGHDRDGDKAEYDDKDKEPHPQHLHNPTHAQGEGGMCLFNGRCTSSVFYSSITKMQIKMIKLDPMLRTGSNLSRVLLERGVELILYIRILYLELLEFLTIQLNAFI